MNIAIDGPAGAGKSSVARAVAQTLNMIYVDTGAMYRAIAYAADERGVACQDEKALLDMMSDLQIALSYDDDQNQHIFLQGEDVTDLIRSDRISKLASNVSVYDQVRRAMVRMQQDLAKRQEVVMDGRDIGTVVLPDATYKFFITADATERAKRRIKEWNEKGIPVTQSLEEVKRSIEERDYADMNRSVSPLRQANGAILLDTTQMTLDETVQAVLRSIATEKDAQCFI